MLKELLEKNFEVVMTFRRTLSQETDRGCALMAASYLENELSQLLKSKLIGTKKQIDSLFEFNGPLGTFSSRIKMSYALGLISKETQNDLDIIRDIRNKFGHMYQPIDFETQQIKEKINNLKSHFHEKSVKPRSIFTNTVLGVLAEIHAETATASKFPEKKSRDFDEQWKKDVKKNAEVNAKEVIEDITKKWDTVQSQEELTKMMANGLLSRMFNDKLKQAAKNKNSSTE